MSAISVVWMNADSPPARWLQQKALSALHPYGSDRQSFWNDNRISLGSNFSSSLPEDRFDTQPLWSEDRLVCLVADARLDNRAELARDLGLVHPEQMSDSSFLMAAWLRWGAACLDHLVGGFAFAVWSPSRQELFAARDHAGERPLFYHRGKDVFALASMPQGLLALPDLAIGIREQYVATWLTGLYKDRSETFFEGIERLPAGHFLRITPDRFERKQYWHPASTKPTRFAKDGDYAEALLEIFDVATEARLRSVKPVGSFLSAGLDSSSVTASAARHLAKQGKPLTAFTSVPRPDYNNIALPGLIPIEAEGAKSIARLYPNIDHRIVDSRGYDLLPSMKRCTDAWDVPSPNLVNTLWMTAIFDQAKQCGIGVMLGGDMGNCTISWSNWTILGHLFQRGRWIELTRMVHGLRQRGAISYKTALRYATQTFVSPALTRRLVGRKKMGGLFAPLVNPDWMSPQDLEDRILDLVYGGSSNPISEHSRFFEFCDLGATNAMTLAANQVEIRDPTADKRIFEFSFSIPPEQFLAGGQSRSLARRAMKGRLPEAILQQTTRGLQSADWYLPMTEALPALRNELALIAQSPIARKTLDLPRMQQLLDTFPKANFEQPEVRMVWHLALTYAISLGYFLRSHEAALTASQIPGPSAIAATPVSAPLK
jgi:asparagine synthase (glutamine-hydrolysing)